MNTAQYPVITARGTMGLPQGHQQLCMYGMWQCTGLAHPEALVSALFLCLFKSKLEKCQNSLPSSLGLATESFPFLGSSRLLGYGSEYGPRMSKAASTVQLPVFHI